MLFDIVNMVNTPVLHGAGEMCHPCEDQQMVIMLIYDHDGNMADRFEVGRMPMDADNDHTRLQSYLDNRYKIIVVVEKEP